MPRKITVAAVFCIILFLFCACSDTPAYKMTGNSPEAARLSPCFDRALRAYYGLADSDGITEYMLASVDKVTINRSVFDTAAHSETSVPENQTLVDVFINGEYSCGGVIERVIYSERYAGISAALDAYAATSGSNWGIGKYLSYFSYKDPAEKGIDRKAKTDMFTRFPMTTDMRARYVADPAIKYRETVQILEILESSGLLDALCVADGAVTLDCLDVFVNLKTVEYANLSVSGVPDGVELKEITPAPDVVSGMEDFDLYKVYEN